MRNALVAAAALLLASACSRAPQTPPTFVDYVAPGGRFSARLPVGWRVDDRAAGERLADFFAPGGGADVEMIEVSFHPTGGQWPTASSYVYAQAATGRANSVSMSTNGALTFGVSVERDVVDEHQGRRVLRVRILAVSAAGGYYVLQEFTNPARKEDSAAFEDFVTTFRPGRK